MISSPDARVVASWSSCLESLKKFLLALPLEHDGSVWKKAFCQDNLAGKPLAAAAAAKRKNKASNPPPDEIRHGQQQHSNLRGSLRQEFLRAILGHVGGGGDSSHGGSAASISDPERLPSLDAAYLDFLRLFPRFAESLGVDEMRAREYAHLVHRVCLDYSGFGLFSHLQRVCDARSSSFRLAYVAASLPAHALYGAPAADRSSSIEAYIRRKIMDHFRVSDSDYCMVFTASKGSAIRLLAESYRFDIHGRLLTAYDHCSQSIEWMIELARDKGAKVSSVSFRWPSLRICSRDLRRQLMEKKKRRRDSSSSIKGLFVFPLQSRVSGARYSYQWIPFAQEQHWHVLLDASALGPREMDALGLSVFRPDFIVASFYKVFGADASGFGCLFIKRSAIESLSSSSRARSVGMVKLLPCSLHQDHEQEIRENGHDHAQDVDNSDIDPSNVSSFSGPLSGEDTIVRDDFVAAMADKHATRKPFDRAIREDDGGEDKMKPADSSSRENTQGAEASSTSTAQVEFPPRSPQRLFDTKGKRKMVEEAEAAESSLANQMRWAESLQNKERFGDAAAPAPPGVQTLAQLLHLPETIQDNEATKPAPVKTLKQLIVVPEPLSPEKPELPHASFPEDDGADEDDPEAEAPVVCLALDQTKILGMINITNRLRYLVSWLVLSLIKLRHPASCHGSFKPPLVQIYGPSERKYNRGASMAFNLYDWDGLLFQPALVQRLADRNSISLGLAQIKNVKFPEFVPDIQNISSRKSSSNAAGHDSSSGGCQDIVVVTIALSYVSSFEDVYRVWGFVAKFLDADFVNKEVWRYHSLNQKVVVLEGGDLSPYHAIP